MTRPPPPASLSLSLYDTRIPEVQLGPDALNLSGTRPGAERIAHALGALGTFDDVPGGGVRDVAGAARRRAAERKQRRSGGEGNFFEGLEVEGGGTGV